MTPTILDHTLVFLVAIGLPLWASITYRRFLARVKAGGGAARLSEYKWTTAIQWCIAGLALAVWAHHDRDFAMLGFQLPVGTRSWLVAALCVALAAFFVKQSFDLRAPGADLSDLGPQLEPVRDLMPQSKRELRWFMVVSCTAGFCEEVLYRGYLLRYLDSLSEDIGPWSAVLIAGCAFGFAHAYQGTAGILKTGVVGLLAGSFLVLGGSLWPLILLHAVVDISGGWIGHHYLTKVEPKAAPQSEGDERR